MARIVEGIKELLRGKDDDDRDYRYRYDQRGAPGSKRYDGYPTNASPKDGYPSNARVSLEGRSGYPAEGRGVYPAEGRSGYPAEGRSGYPAEGRSGYPAEGRSGYPAEGRSGYPVEGRSVYPAEGRSGYPAEGRSGYPAEGRGGYPAEGRSGYPVEGRSGYPAEGQSGYPVPAVVDGRSGYAANLMSDGQSSYPVDGRSGYPVTSSGDGRGYPASSIPEVRSSYPTEGRSSKYPVSVSGDGRSGYPIEGRSGYSTEGRSGYPVSVATDGRGGSPMSATGGYSTEGRGGYSTEGRSGYPVSAATDGRGGSPMSATGNGRSGYPTNATVGGFQVPLERQTMDDDYVRSTYDTRSEARGEYRQSYTSSPRGPEYNQAYGIRDSSLRTGPEYRASPRVEIPPRSEYVRTTQPSPREYQSSTSGRSVIELMVPMCCIKCKEKVEEELNEVDGVDSVRCDPKNSRVIVTGNQFIDVERCLAKAERAVKKKCELVSNQAEGGTPNSKKVTSPSGYYETVAKTGILTPPSVSNSGSPSGRPSLVRMPSFASGKVTQYNGVGPRGQDYEDKDYSGFRRMPSFGKSRHHEAEYISSYDERRDPRSSSHGEFNAPIRRMPSLNRSRYHDAEYMAAEDGQDYNPRSFYENGSSYTASYNDRPSLLSQVSFSKIPVENPSYMKQIGNY